MITLPKKGQVWLWGQEQLRIKGVGRGLVSYDVPATGAVGISELMYFLQHCCRLTTKMKARLKQNRRAD